MSTETTTEFGDQFDDTIQVQLYQPEPFAQFTELSQLLPLFGLVESDLLFLTEFSPYLILDGHRTGIADSDQNPARGYVEGAIFSLRFATILKRLGGRQATFLIHTLRNYKTMDRMAAIFDAIGDVGKKFIKKSKQEGIHLQYFGHEVHSDYALADVINLAEHETRNCKKFNLNFLTNYSDDWAVHHLKDMEDIPEITVIGRFTKGHYSGASIPGHASKANFSYIQQASVSENWTDMELVCLILSLLRSHLALRGFVGGKSYGDGEKDEIREKRELEMWMGEHIIHDEPSKRIISFSPQGPMMFSF